MIYFLSMIMDDIAQPYPTRPGSAPSPHQQTPKRWRNPTKQGWSGVSSEQDKSVCLSEADKRAVNSPKVKMEKSHSISQLTCLTSKYKVALGYDARRVAIPMRCDLRTHDYKQARRQGLSVRQTLCLYTRCISRSEAATVTVERRSRSEESVECNAMQGRPDPGCASR